jgi:myo-inositol-1-phosphate synthase
VHRALLGLLSDRGLTLTSSYQLNLGGNEDFKNLRVVGESKRASKLNALAQEGVDTSKVEVIPSAGFVAHLHDHKVGMLNIEAVGWAGTPASVDLKLKVQDSSNAAGVIIDLIRIGAAAKRRGLGGFPAAAARILKSPAGGHPSFTEAMIEASLHNLDPAGEARSA